MFFPAQPYLSDLEWQFDRLVKGVGCNGGPDRNMTCLRGKSTLALQAANKASPFPGRTQPPLPLFYWTPCIDGDLIRKLPYDMFDEGKNIDVPLMVGATSDGEMSPMSQNPVYHAKLTFCCQRGLRLRLQCRDKG